MSGLFFPLRKEEWPKWYKALTISGKAAGLGFCCPKCHLHYRHSVPPEGIFHCGALEKPPRFTALLPVRSLGRDSGLMPPNIFPAFWDDEEEQPNGKHSILRT